MNQRWLDAERRYQLETKLESVSRFMDLITST